MLITTELIKSFKPCSDRFENWITHYNSFEGSIGNFLELDKITDKDKVWVIVRILKQGPTNDFNFASWVSELIKAEKVHWRVAQYALSHPHVKDHPQFASLVSELIKAGKTDWSIAQYVLSQPHVKDHPQFASLVSELIKAGKADLYIADYVLSQLHLKDHPLLLHWKSQLNLPTSQRS